MAEMVTRYHTAAENDDTTPYSVDSKQHNLDSLRGKYVCLVIGQQIINFGTMYISTKTDALYDQNQSFIYRIEAVELINETIEKPVFEILVKPGESVLIDRMPFGTYTITAMTDWSWRYNTPISVQTYNIETLEPIMVEFSNLYENDYWFDANSVSVVNAYGVQ